MGKGFLEPIYQEALSWELEQRGVYNRREVMLNEIGRASCRERV